MVGAVLGGHGQWMQRSEQELLAEIRATMARLGQSVDDLTDNQLRARAVRLVGDRPDALEVILRALVSRDDLGPAEA
jgi:hypothetical protein